MGENSLKVLSFLAIIIGASGLGFGTYSLMQVQSGAVKGDDGDDGDDGSDGADGTIIRIDSKRCSAVYCNPINQYLPINELNITFNIFLGEAVYFLYTGVGEIFGVSFVTVVFIIDGKRVPNVFASFSLGDVDPSHFYESSLSMQFSNTTMSEGSHEITVARIGDESFNSVNSNMLYIQIYRS